MRYRINQIKLNPGHSFEDLEKAVSKKAGKKISNIEIIKQSIDARRKPDVKLVYTVDFDCEDKLKLDEGKRRKYQIHIPESFSINGKRPVVCGFGPCGIFAGLILAQAGLKPLIIERGKNVEERAADVQEFWEKCESPNSESNVQFGEGGAGTFSDGKLTTGIKDIRIRKVLEEFVEAGANPEILYKQKPHLGTDKLRGIIKNIREKIIELGGEVRFSARMEDVILHEEGTMKGIVVRNLLEDKEETIESDILVLAIGHSARDTFKRLYEEGMEMEQKPFSIGVRIEHPQEMINQAQYGNGELAKLIGAAEYKLNHRCESGRGVYTFCMCPGGEVVNASTESQTSVTNGMSNSARDGETANSALLVDVRTEDYANMIPENPNHPLAGIEFQKKYERLAWENRKDGYHKNMASSTYGELKAGGSSVEKSLPKFATESILEAMPYLGKKLKGFDREDAVMTAVETRSSSPVRIARDKNMQSSIKGIIPAGEGPGYAGGIMSAAVEGIKAAEEIIRIRSGYFND